MTLREALALELGPSPGRDDDLTDARLRELWEAHRDELMAAPGPPPLALWMFEPDVPDELRAERFELTPVVDDPDADRDAGAARADLDRRRAAWLAARG